MGFRVVHGFAAVVFRAGVDPAANPVYESLADQRREIRARMGGEDWLPFGEASIDPCQNQEENRSRNELLTRGQHLRGGGCGGDECVV